MPAPSNLSFETGSAGAATGWALVPASTYEELADFAGRPWERFEEGWDDNENYLFSLDSVEAAEFGTILVDVVKTSENFEELWLGNESYVRDLTSPEPEPAVFDGANDFDDFTGWAPGFLTAFVGVGSDLTAGDFDPGAGTAEGFEAAGWAPTYKTAFTGIGSDLEAATFDNGGQTAERFAAEQAPRAFSVVLATDVLTLVGSNPFVNNDKVFVTAEGSYPSPLQATQAYYVRDTSGLTNKLALSPGGAAIDITTAPTGAVFLTGDPVLYWTEKMVTTSF